MFLIVWAAFVFFAPNMLGDPNNFIPANPLQTPADIVPEWYFLPYYAILRSVPNKLLGVCFMFGSLLVLFVLPWLDTSRVRSARFRPTYRKLILLLVLSFLVLGYCGAHKPEGIYVILSRVAALYYFAHFLVIMPILGKLERPLPLPESITQAVTGRPIEAASPAARWRATDAHAPFPVRPIPALVRVLAVMRAARASGARPRRRRRRRARTGASAGFSAPQTSPPRNVGFRFIPRSVPTAMRCIRCIIAI